MVRVYNSGQNKSQLKVEGHARIKKEKKKKPINLFAINFTVSNLAILVYN